MLAGNCKPANNNRGDYVRTGVVKIHTEGKPYVYFLTVTPKGEKAMAKNISAYQATAPDTGKPVKKVKATKRPAKAAGKVKPVQATPVALTPVAPTSEAAPVTEGMPTLEHA